MNSTTWTVLEYDIGRELPVSRSLHRLGLIYFLPVELRQRRISKHSKRRDTYEVPMIPGVVFVRGQDTWMIAVKAQYTKDGPRQTNGVIWCIPEPQMLSFQGAVAEWNDVIRKKTQRNEDAPKLKKRTMKFEPESFVQIMAELFGPVEQAKAA